MMDYLMNQYEQGTGDPAAEVHTVQMPNLALRTEAVLAGKDIQAAILPDPLAAYAVQQGAHVVIDDTKLQKNYSQSVVVLTQDMIEKHHDDAAHFDATNEAIEKLDSQPDAYRDMAMKKANIPAAVAGSYRTPSYTAHALPTEEEVSRIMNWMVEKACCPRPPAAMTKWSPMSSNQPMAGPLLRLDDVGLAYHSRRGIQAVLQHISFSLAQGEHLTVSGPSGCGKSPLLRLIAGLQAPTEGQIYFAGQK